MAYCSLPEQGSKRGLSVEDIIPYLEVRHCEARAEQAAERGTGPRYVRTDPNGRRRASLAPASDGTEPRGMASAPAARDAPPGAHAAAPAPALHRRHGRGESCARARAREPPPEAVLRVSAWPWPSPAGGCPALPPRSRHPPGPSAPPSGLGSARCGRRPSIARAAPGSLPHARAASLRRSTRTRRRSGRSRCARPWSASPAGSSSPAYSPGAARAHARARLFALRAPAAVRRVLPSPRARVALP